MMVELVNVRLVLRAGAVRILAQQLVLKTVREIVCMIPVFARHVNLVGQETNVIRKNQ